MVEWNDETLRFTLRQFARASERAHLCVAHFDTTKKDYDRCAALLAIGEASGLRNLMRHMMRDLPAEVCTDMYSLDLEANRLTHAESTI